MKNPTTATDADRTTKDGGMMQAIVQDAYGTVDVFRYGRTARPEIADNEVLVQVRAAASTGEPGT